MELLRAFSSQVVTLTQKWTSDLHSIIIMLLFKVQLGSIIVKLAIHYETYCRNISGYMYLGTCSLVYGKMFPVSGAGAHVSSAGRHVLK